MLDLFPSKQMAFWEQSSLGLPIFPSVETFQIAVAIRGHVSCVRLLSGGSAKCCHTTYSLMARRLGASPCGLQWCPGWCSSCHRKHTYPWCSLSKINTSLEYCTDVEKIMDPCFFFHWGCFWELVERQPWPWQANKDRPISWPIGSTIPSSWRLVQLGPRHYIEDDSPGGKGTLS